MIVPKGQALMVSQMKGGSTTWTPQLSLQPDFAFAELRQPGTQVGVRVRQGPHLQLKPARQDQRCTGMGDSENGPSPGGGGRESIR